jgi:Zn-dependent proteases
MFDLNAIDFQRVAIFLVPMFIGVILHEVAHGYAAYRFGDPTAKMMGRLTLNPIKHIDPTGLLIFVLTALFAPFAIGWAKPVPINARYFKNPARDMAITSFAGPLTNFLVAIGFAILMLLVLKIPALRLLVSQTPALWQVMEAGIWINILLAWFNLLPIPPMDGSHILYSVLPREIGNAYAKIGRYGMIIVIVLLATGLLWDVLEPLLLKSANLVIDVFNLPPLWQWLIFK